MGTISIGPGPPWWWTPAPAVPTPATSISLVWHAIPGALLPGHPDALLARWRADLERRHLRLGFGNEFSYRPIPLSTAADGTLYVAFEEVDNSTAPLAELFLDRSTDGGLTWGTDQPDRRWAITPIGRPDWKGRELTLVGRCQLPVDAY